MGLASKEAWMSLFSEAVSNAWSEERPELRKVAMILIAYDQELKRIKYAAEVQMLELRKQFNKIENTKKQIISSESYLNKQALDETNVKFFEFKNVYPEIPQVGNSLNENIIINRNNSNSHSPDIFTADSDDNDNDKLRVHKRSANTINNNSNYLSKPNVVTNKEKVALKSLSPKINKSSNIIRGKVPKLKMSAVEQNNSNNTSQSLLNMGKEVENVHPGFNDSKMYMLKTTKFKKSHENPQKTLKNMNLMDNSVIDTTPELTRNSKRAKYAKSSPFSSLSKSNDISKNANFRSSTLTQLFDDLTKNNVKQNSINEKKITPISPIKENKLEVENLEVELCESPPSYDCESFVKNYNRMPRKESQSPKNDVVRGKKRMNLKGWSCDDCKNYYQALNLTEKELQEKINKCSRHRSKFKHMDTPQGFWDLTFPATQETKT